MAAFKQQWNVEQPEEPLSQMQTLDNSDLQRPFNSWRDLMTAHNVVEHHYAIAGLEIPDETIKRHISEVNDYEREIAAYRMSEEHQNNEVRAFQEQLKNVSQQKQQPKPR